MNSEYKNKQKKKKAVLTNKASQYSKKKKNRQEKKTLRVKNANKPEETRAAAGSHQIEKKKERICYSNVYGRLNVSFSSRFICMFVPCSFHNGIGGWIDRPPCVDRCRNRIYPPVEMRVQQCFWFFFKEAKVYQGL
jgi:hypothetical protein